MKNNMLRTLSFFGVLALSTGCEKPEEDISPATEVSVIAVKVINMPLRDPNGHTWDLLDDADLSFNLEGATSVLYKHQAFYPNVNYAKLPLTFYLTHPYLLPGIDQTYSISLYDYDDLIDDLIDRLDFEPGKYKYERPPTITVTDGNAVIEISLSWN